MGKPCSHCKKKKRPMKTCLCPHMCIGALHPMTSILACTNTHTHGHMCMSVCSRMHAHSKTGSSVKENNSEFKWGPPVFAELSYIKRGGRGAGNTEFRKSI